MKLLLAMIMTLLTAPSSSSAAAPRAPSANFGSEPSGSSSKDNRRLIIDGEVANPSDYPYYVDVILTSTNQCGGTLIAPNVVLTAGHCMDDVGDYVNVGAYENDSVAFGSKKVKVIEKVKHPGFNFFTLQNDFGLLLLEEDADGHDWANISPVDPVQPEALPNCTVEVQLAFRTDNFPVETWWQLTNEGTGEFIGWVPSGTYDQIGTEYTETWTLCEDACYNLAFHDYYGDGLLASQGAWIELRVDGEVIERVDGSDLQFGSSREFPIFCNDVPPLPPLRPELHVVGHGYQDLQGTQAQFLNEARVNLMSNEACIAVHSNTYASGFFDSENMLCSGHWSDGDGRACKGDSGGPVVRKNPDGRDDLYGVVSWGLLDNPYCISYPLVSAKVSSAFEWIKETVCEEWNSSEVVCEEWNTPAPTLAPSTVPTPAPSTAPTAAPAPEPPIFNAASIGIVAAAAVVSLLLGIAIMLVRAGRSGGGAIELARVANETKEDDNEENEKALPLPIMEDSDDEAWDIAPPATPEP